jgi:hypothetical protein
MRVTNSEELTKFLDFVRNLPPNAKPIKREIGIYGFPSTESKDPSRKWTPVGTLLIWPEYLAFLANSGVFTITGGPIQLVEERNAGRYGPLMKTPAVRDLVEKNKQLCRVTGLPDFSERLSNPASYILPIQTITSIDADESVSEQGVIIKATGVTGATCEYYLAPTDVPFFQWQRTWRDEIMKTIQQAKERLANKQLTTVQSAEQGDAALKCWFCQLRLPEENSTLHLVLGKTVLLASDLPFMQKRSTLAWDWVELDVPRCLHCKNTEEWAAKFHLPTLLSPIVVGLVAGLVWALPITPHEAPIFTILRIGIPTVIGLVVGWISMSVVHPILLKSKGMKTTYQLYPEYQQLVNYLSRDSTFNFAW